MGMRAEYATRPREQITQVLKAQRRFLSAADIYRLLERARAKVALSTVYRTLERLRAKGEITARVDPEGEATFMLCEPTHHHHHAICTRCGRVEDVDCAAIDAFVESLRARNGFTLRDHAMEFYGTCAACQ
jgi:Fur family ferric uptake transcriptional regulator